MSVAPTLCKLLITLTTMNEQQQKALSWLRTELRVEPPKKIDNTLQRNLKRGWLIPYLVAIESQLWGRWEYWSELMEANALTDTPIPQIEFHDGRGGGARKHLERCLDLVPNQGSGSWKGWSSWQNFNYFLDWLLYGFGYVGQQELPPEPRGCEGASMRLYQMFNLHWVLAHPYDYWGDILAESGHGRHSGFYPTPHCIARMMSLMIQGTYNHERRAASCYDCACGTGRMLLEGSNNSLQLFGQDKDLTVCKAAVVNGFWYMPWLVKPFPFLKGESTDEVVEVTAEQAPPEEETQAPLYTIGEDWKAETIKRRKKGVLVEVEQGLLF